MINYHHLGNLLIMTLLHLEWMHVPIHLKHLPSSRIKCSTFLLQSVYEDGKTRFFTRIMIWR